PTGSGFNLFGALTIVNDAGKDINDVFDSNVQGNVLVDNGLADPTQFALGISGKAAGATQFGNSLNTSVRASIGGNLTILNTNGAIDTSPLLEPNRIADLEILGNVFVNHGRGQFVTDMTNEGTSLPTLVHHNVTVTGTGTSGVDLGIDVFGRNKGLIISGKPTITTGAGRDTINTFNLEVDRATTMTLG